MKRHLVTALLGALALALPCSAAHAIDVSGTLSTDTVWSTGNSYRMTGQVYVPAGVTLTIEPGATVQAVANTTYNLSVSGTLKVGVYSATGLPDPALRVTLGTATASSYWGGIYFASTSTGSQLKNAEISWASNCVRVDAPSVTFDDVLIHNCSGYGLGITSTSAGATFRGSGSAVTAGGATAKVYSASTYGIYNTGTLSVSGTEVYSNSQDGIYSTGNSLISACNVHNNGGTGAYYGINWTGALSASGIQRVERSLIWQNSRGGLYSSLYTVGLQHQVDHNTFDRNSVSGSTSYELYLYVTASNGLTVVDNIVTGNRNYGLYRSSGTATVTVNHNLVWNNGSANYYGVTDGGGGVSCNPLFVSATGTNYRITSNSPARGVDSTGTGGDLGALAYVNDATPGLQGILRQSTTLTAAGGPYDLVGDLVVPAGVTLTIEPGTRINPATSDSMKCNADASHVELIIRGALSAAGTAASPIVFAPATSTTKGSWYGLVLDDAATTTGTLSYLDIGYGVVGLTTRTSSLTVTNSKIHHSSGDGVLVERTTSSLTFSGSLATAQVTDNGQVGIHNYGALTATNASVLRNGYSGINSTGNSQITGAEIGNNGSSSSSSGFGVTFNGSLASGTQSLSRCVVHHNYVGGISVTPAAGTTVLVESNTFDHDDTYTGTTYEAYLYTSSAGTLSLRNNIFTNNKSYGLYRYYSYGTVSASYNLTNGLSTEYYGVTEGAGGVHCNPLYVANDGTNYRITENSPARNADSMGNDLGALAYTGDATVGLAGILRASKVLTAAGSPWQLPGDLIVPAGTTLTLEAGATLVPATTDAMKCGSSSYGVELVIQGSLIVSGTAANRAVIKPSGTAPYAGSWSGVRIAPGSTGNAIAGLEVAYAETGIDVETTGLTLTNTKVHDCSNYGVNVNGGASLTMTGDAPKYGGHFLFESQVGNAGYYGLYAAGDVALSNTEFFSSYSGNVYTLGKATMTGCDARDSNYGWGIYMEVPGGSATNRVDHCVVHHNGGGGIRVQTPTSGGTAVLDHNTVDANTTYGLYLYNMASAANAIVLKNNLVTNTGGSYGYGVYKYYYSGTGTISATYNDVWNNYYGYSGVTAGAGSLTSDPLYNYPAGNTAGHDYRLQPASPARAADGDTPRGDMGALPYYAIVPGSVTISPTTTTLVPGDTATFTAQATETWSNFPVAGFTCSYSVVSAPGVDVGTINAGGVFTAGCSVGPHPAAIVAQSGTATATAAVTINAGNPASVTVTPSTTSVALNQSTSFQATARDACGNPSTLETIDWAVMTAGAGIVNASGLFTAGTRAGTFVDLVRATTHSTGKMGFATVTVVPSGVATVLVSPSSATVAAGATGRFTAVAKDAFNNVVVPFAPVWSLQSSCTLGTLDPVTGVFTAGTTAGSCTGGIVATDPTSGVQGTASVTVSAIPGTLASITLSPATPTVAVNGTLPLTATGHDGSGNTVAITPTWSVASGGGTIDATTGMLTAGCTTGSFAVTATVGTVTGTVNVTVNPGPLATIAVSPSSADVPVRTTKAFTATGQDSCGNSLSVSPVWAVVAAGGTINSTGTFTAGGSVGTFTQTVRATASGIPGFATVRVIAGPATSIAIAPSNPSIALGGQQPFTASGRDQYGNVTAITPAWSVVNGGGAIDAASGVFTAGTVAGSFVNTVKATSGTLSATTSITVLPGPLATIAVSPASGNVAARQQLQFTAVGRDASGNAVPFTPSWSVVAGGGAINGASGLFTAGGVAGSYPSTIKALDASTNLFGTASVTVLPGPLATLAVAPSSATVNAGATQQFTASGSDADGNPATFTPTWSMASTCTKGTISATGRFTAGTTPGSCPDGIKATSGGLTATASVEVVVGPLSRIEITPTTVQLDPEGTQQLTAVGKDAAGNVLPVTITWRLVTPAAGTLSASGLFAAGTVAGTYRGAIAADSGSVTGTADVVVRPGPLATLTVAPTSATVAALSTQQFTATGKDSWNNTVAVTPSWSVVAGGGTIVGATGWFTAGTQLGTFTDTVRATSGSISATASVTVVVGPLARIVITPSPATVAVGGTVQFAARGEDAAGNAVAVTPTWSMAGSGGTVGATSGLFTAGTLAATFTNTVKATSGTVSGYASVTVTAGPLATISVYPANTTLAINGTQLFSATCRDASANAIYPCAVTWSVSAGASAGTVATNGLFTASTTAGTYAASVHATVGAIDGTAGVTVLPGPLAQVSLTPSSVVLAPNATQQFAAMGKDSYGNPLASSITWSVVNGGGTLNATGLFTAGSAAGAFANTVKAVSGPFSAFATVTVATGGLASISIDPPSPVVLATGATQQFTATGTDVFGNPVTLTNLVWSAASGSGTIDPATGSFTAGCATGVFAGAVHATVGAISASADVTVTPGPLTTLAITPANPTLATGATQTFTAVGKDACNNALPAIAPTWTVSNAQAGAITSAGVFTASTTAGTYADVVHAQQGTVSATASLTLVAGTIQRVVVTPASASVGAGVSRTFTAAAYDSSDNLVTGTTFTWSVVNGGGTLTSAGVFTAGTTAGNYLNTVEARATGGVSGYASVVVVPGSVSQVVVTSPSPPAPAQVAVLGTVPFTAQARDANGNALPNPIVWSVVRGGGTIDAITGVFTASTTAGTFANSVKAACGAVSATVDVVVLPGPAAQVAVSPPDAQVAVGAQQVFTAAISDAFGNAITAGATPTWSVVASGGTISATGGVFTAGTVAGTFADTIEATFQGVTGQASVTVLPGPSATLTLDPTSATLQVHATRQFSVTAADDYGNPVVVAATWSIAAPGAGTLDATGLFTAGAAAGSYPGAVRVTAVEGGMSASADVTLTPGPLGRIDVLPASVELKPGDRQLFVAEGRDADENLIELMPTWTLLDPSAGTLGMTGLLTAGSHLGVYTEVVQVEAEGLTGFASVTIVAPPIARVLVVPDNPKVPITGTQTFGARALDAKGIEVIGLPATWALVAGGGALSADGEFTAADKPGVFPNTVQATVGGVSGTTGVVLPTDFDQDGMDDVWELAHGFDPTNAADAQEDPDHDGLKNVDEFRAGADPFDADSDDDGVLDGNEVKPTEDTDGDGLANAMDPDSDDDGLPDGLEMGVTKPNADTDVSKGHFIADEDPSTTTDPLKKDTDDDGLEDGAEDVNHNGKVDPGETDPNQPNCTTSADCKDNGICVDGVCHPQGELTCDPACAGGEVCNPTTLTCEAGPGVAKQSGCGCASTAAEGGGGSALASIGLLLAVAALVRRRRACGA